MPGRGAARDALAGIRALLEQTRADMLGVLLDDLDPAGRSPTDYDRFLAQQKERAIGEALVRLERELLAASNDTLAGAAQLGVDDLAGRMGQLLVRAPTIGVDTGTLQFVQQFAGTQIVGVVSDVRVKVNGAMQRAIAGALDLRGLQREIRDAFGGNVTSSRVERIVRTETVRAYTQAQAAADEQLVDEDVDLELIKVWVTVGGDRGDGRNRSSHLAIHGQERELWQLFNVGGGATDATEPGSSVGFKANAPADPSLPPAEGIQCRCTVHYRQRNRAKQPYIEKDLDKVRAAKRARRAA